MSYNNRKEAQNNYQQNRQKTLNPQYYHNNNIQYTYPQYMPLFAPPYHQYQNQQLNKNSMQVYGSPKNMHGRANIYQQHPSPQNNYYYQSYPQPHPQGFMPNYTQNYSQASPQQYNQRNMSAPKSVNTQKTYSKTQNRNDRQERNNGKNYSDDQPYRQNMTKFVKQDSHINQDNLHQNGYKRQNIHQKDNKNSPYKNFMRKIQRQERELSQDEPVVSDSQLISQSESEQQIFFKKKFIYKKKDPVLDSKQQICKWIEARKRNYPKKNILPQQMEKKKQQLEISLLEKKIRKKICLINADPRSMLKKMKDIDILRRFMLYHRKNKRVAAKSYPAYPREDKQQVIYQKIQKEKDQTERQKQVQEIQTVKAVQKQPNAQLECEIVQQVEAVEIPIKRDHPQPVASKQNGFYRREQLSVDVIIKHLQMRQQQDVKTLQNLMDYKSNSSHFRYQHQTLETNLLLDSIFRDTSYMLQSIRYIVKNNFFDKKELGKSTQSLKLQN